MKPTKTSMYEGILYLGIYVKKWTILICFGYENKSKHVKFMIVVTGPWFCAIPMKPVSKERLR
jgi:hypothetical protein